MSWKWRLVEWTATAAVAVAVRPLVWAVAAVYLVLSGDYRRK